MPTAKLHTRGLTSFFTLFGFLIMSVTGLVLYVVPAGRVAYWINWQMGGMTKTDWGNIHILSSILFVVAGAIHTWLNWKPLMNYFKDRVSKGIRLRRELAISSVVSVWIVISALFPIPPLSYLLDFNEWLKETWIVETDYEPPFGHAELLSLQTFSKKMEIDPDAAAAELRAKGVSFDSPEETLGEIAERNNTSPMNIYLLIKKFEPAPEPEKLQAYTAESIELEFSGSGIGNKKLSAVCERQGVDPVIARTRLAAAGLPDDLDQTMKAAAETAGVTPVEIMKVLLLEDYRLPKE